MDRLKTGTPARVDSRTVNLASLEAQPGDADVRWFSFDSSVGALIPRSSQMTDCSGSHYFCYSTASSSPEESFAFLGELALIDCPPHGCHQKPSLEQPTAI